MRLFLSKIKFKHIFASSVLIGTGLGLGSIVTLFILSNNHPTLIVEDKWKTITTAPTIQPDLGHSSLNPDELNHLLQMQGQPGVAGVTSSTTSTTKPAPTTTTPTIATTTLPPITQPPTTLPPSTLPPSSTTLTSVTTSPPTTNPPTTVTTDPPTTTSGT